MKMSHVTNGTKSWKLEMLYTHPSSHYKPRCQQFLLPWRGTRPAEPRSEKQSSSAASRFSWCPVSVGYGEGKWGWGCSGQVALWMQHDHTPGTGWRRRSKQFTVVYWGDRRGRGREASALGVQRDAAGCHFQERGCQKLFPSCSRRLVGNSLGERDQAHA